MPGWNSANLPVRHSHCADALDFCQGPSRPGGPNSLLYSFRVHKHSADLININQRYVYLINIASWVNFLFMKITHSGDRLKQIASERGIPAKSLAESIGISPQSLNNWFARGIPAASLSVVTALFWLDRHWLEYGEGEPDMPGSPWAKSGKSGAHHPDAQPMSVWDDETPLDDDEVYVPFLKEVELSAGAGRTVVEPSHKQKIRFGKATLRRQNVQPDEAVCVTISGDSMEPVLPHGSTVGVNTGATSVVDGKMYAIDHAGQLRVKTLYRIPGGGLRLRSFNREDHPDEEYSAEDLAGAEIRVIGKVFWSSALW